jgi:prephenate dehydrogenase
MKIGIVGTGLIGASIGMALKKHGHTVCGWDLNQENSATAKRRFALDEALELHEVCKSDVVFICVPPASLIESSKTVYEHKLAETIVTDCGSVKSALTTWAKDKSDYVPGHPMAGHEKGGPLYASDWLFRNAKWILTPSESTSKSAIKQVESLIREMQAIPIHLAPDLHDQHVALLSHLPHILAGLLVEMGADLKAPEVSGGSWKDLTRVGGVDPGLWTQILIENRSQIDSLLGDFQRRLEAIRQDISSSDAEAISKWLTQVAKTKHGS